MSTELWRTLFPLSSREELHDFLWAGGQSRWNVWTPSRVKRACFPGDLPCSTLSTEIMLVQLRTACPNPNPALPLLVLWINGIFPKNAAPLVGGFVSVAGTLLRYKLKRVPFKGLFIVNSRARTYTPTQNQGTTAIIERTNCQAGGGTESKVQKSRKLSELWEWQLDMSQCWIVWKELRHLTAVQELQGCGPPACCHLRQH